MKCNNKKSSIVFVNQSSGYLMIDIINAFEKKYNERVLLTGSLNPRNIKLDSDVIIHWLTEYKRNSSILRIFTWLSAFLKSLYLIITNYRHSDLFLVSNPPLSSLATIFCKNRVFLLIYDLYPDALVEFKYLKKNNLIVKGWEKANKKAFTKAEKIFTISQEMKERLQKYSPYEEKIEVISLWSDNRFFKVKPKNENRFIIEQNLENKFIVMYSGNLGKTHPIEVIVDLANASVSEEIFFIIIGEGDKYSELSKLVENNTKKNIKLLPWQPTEMLPFTFASSDLAIITLENQASNLSLPSKTYNFLSVGSPILGICSKESSLAKLILQNQVGIVFQKDQIQKILNYIENLTKDNKLHKSLINNSLRTSYKFTPQNASKFLDYV